MPFLDIGMLPYCFSGFLQVSATEANFENPDYQDSTNIDGLAAGRTVCFSGSTTTADLTPMFDTSVNMTIELYVKTCQDVACQGVIFTYAVGKTLAVWNRGTVVITYDDYTWDTGFYLEDDKWNQIALVWKKRISELDVYVFHSNGQLTGKETLSEANGNMLPLPNPFRYGGKMSLARWQPSPDDTGEHANDNFKGCIDELRIWQK